MNDSKFETTLLSDFSFLTFLTNYIRSIEKSFVKLLNTFY